MPTFKHTRTRLYKAFYISQEFGNGSTLVTAKNGSEALAKARKIGLIVNNTRQENVRFESVKFMRWIDSQAQFIWKTEVSKQMNLGNDIFR